MFLVHSLHKYLQSQWRKGLAHHKEKFRLNWLMQKMAAESFHLLDPPVLSPKKSLSFLQAETVLRQVTRFPRSNSATMSRWSFEVWYMDAMRALPVVWENIELKQTLKQRNVLSTFLSESTTNRPDENTVFRKFTKSFFWRSWVAESFSRLHKIPNQNGNYSKHLSWKA